LLALVPGCGGPPAITPPGAKLRVLCGSSMAAPMHEIAREFAAARRIEVEFDLGGSETLLPRILAGARADLFVCHDPFEDKIRTARLCAGSVTVGHLEPVLAVRPGNPKNVVALADLTVPGLKIGIGDPRYSTCGELFVGAIQAAGLHDAVMKNVVLQARTHAEVANGLVLGPLDAVVVWNFVGKLYPGKLQVVPIAVSYPETRVTVLGLSAAEQPRLRDAFLAWCRGPNVREIFRRHGYGRAGD